jgi:sugar lactone lactonase YvrE
MDDMTIFEEQLGKGLDQLAGPRRPVDAMAIAQSITTHSPKWRFQSMFSATKFVVAGAIVALFGGFLLAGVMTQQPTEQIVPAAATASPSDRASYEVTEVARPTDAWPSVATSDALWLTDYDGRTVVRMDAQTGDMTTLSVDVQPGSLVPSEDAIWVVSNSQVQRIDRADLTVSEDTIGRSRGEPFAWAQSGDGAAIIADGSLWIAAPGSETDTLIEIDLSTQIIRDEYPADAIWWGDGSFAWMAAIGDAIWVYSNGQMTRFDLPTRTFTDRVEVPDAVDCCIATDDAIWLGSGEEDSLWRFDTDTLAVSDTLELGASVRRGITAADAIWMSDGGRKVYRLDTLTREVTDVIPVKRGRHFAMFDGAVWTGSGGGGRTLSRINPESAQVVGTLDMPSTHMEMAPLVSENVMWVQTHDTGRLFRVDRVAAAE